MRRSYPALTLALLYVSGGDEYGELGDELGNEQCFQGRRAYKGYDFDILDLLTTAGLIEEQRYPKQVKSVVLTPMVVSVACCCWFSSNHKLRCLLITDTQEHP